MLLNRHCIGAASALLWIMASASSAHMPGDPDAEWYQSLKVPGSPMSCCSPNRDCNPIDDYRPVPKEQASSGFQAYVEGEWVNVGEEALLKRADNPTGKAVACVWYMDGHPRVRCLILPSQA